MRLFICIQMFLCLCLSGHAFAQTIQALDFGSVVVIDNSAQYDITVNTDGSYSHDAGGFIEITPPQEGIYDVDNVLPAGTAVTSVTVTQDVPLTAGVNNFQVVNFTTTNTSPSDGSGVVRVTVGATARSSGTTAPYPDNTYTGTITIQVNF